MHPSVIGPGYAVVRFDRGYQFQFAGRSVAQVHARLRGDHLPVIVNPRQNAAHHRQVVDLEGIGGEPVFKQLSPEDIEPPGRAGVGVIGGAFTQHAGGGI